MSPGNENLQSALRTLAAETAGESAPDQVKRALHSELRRRRVRRRAATWWPALATAAVALVLGIWLGRPRPQQPAVDAPSVAAIESAPSEAPALAEPTPAAPETAAPSARKARLVTATAARPAAGGAMTPWFFYAGLPAAERGQVVRIRVSAATAAQFGVYRGTDDVPAQVFIGDDGVARAIRFVR